MRTTALIILTATGLTFLAPAQQPTPNPAAAAQAAQQDPQPAASAPAPTAKTAETGPIFKSNSYLVIVDVEATDKSGNPIGGLRKEDFTVTEDGKKQEISIFQYQELTQEPEPPE